MPAKLGHRYRKSRDTDQVWSRTLEQVRFIGNSSPTRRHLLCSLLEKRCQLTTCHIMCGRNLPIGTTQHSANDEQYNFFQKPSIYFCSAPFFNLMNTVSLPIHVHVCKTVKDFEIKAKAIKIWHLWRAN